MTASKTPPGASEPRDKQRETDSPMQSRNVLTSEDPITPRNPAFHRRLAHLSPPPFRSAVAGNRLPPAAPTTDLETVMRSVQDRVSELVDDANNGTTIPDKRHRRILMPPSIPPIYETRARKPAGESPASSFPNSNSPLPSLPPSQAEPTAVRPLTDAPLVVHVTSPSTVKGVPYRYAVLLTLLAFAAGMVLAWLAPQETARVRDFHSNSVAAATPSFAEIKAASPALVGSGSSDTTNSEPPTVDVDSLEIVPTPSHFEHRKLAVANKGHRDLAARTRNKARKLTMRNDEPD